MPRPPDLMNVVAWLVGLWLATAAVMLVLVFVHPSVQFHWTTDVYLGATVLFSTLAFLAMGLDKSRAKRQRRRIAESTLHLLELLGGWPGSLIGQRTFRHKTWKMAYQAVFWPIVTVHLAVLAWSVYLWWNEPSFRTPAEPQAAPSADASRPEIEPAKK